MTGTRLIGTVAAEAGVHPRTLRYYEALGILPHPRRTKTGYRLYDDAVRQRLAFVHRAKSLGLTLREIREIAALVDSGERPCPTVRQLLKDQLSRVDQQMADLQTLKADLQGLLASWDEHGVPCPDDAICPRLAPNRERAVTAKGGRVR
jgi:DNA-binding transcriptional MerR regulator